MTKLSDLGEFGLIHHLTHGLDCIHDSIGDDCAIVELGGATLLITSDTAVEGTHFLWDYGTPHDLGWKTAAAALSDIAAMGGQPRYVTISMAIPANLELEKIEAFYQGMADAIQSTHAQIIGGDTTRSQSGLMVDLTVIGEPGPGRILLRSGAEADDVIAVTGYPGRSAAGLLALQGGQDIPPLTRAHLHPIPRIQEGQWLAQQDGVHALMDCSDGMVQDLGHIAKASNLGIELSGHDLPHDPILEEASRQGGFDPQALCLAGGESYELLLAVSKAAFPALATEFTERFNLPLTAIGYTNTDTNGVHIDGQSLDGTPAGYDHFI